MLSDSIVYSSMLNKWDKLKIECALSSQFHEIYNCSDCLKIKNQTKEWRQNNKGCFKPVKEPRAVMDNGTKIYMCLGRMYTYNELQMIDEYKMFVDYKILPKPGHIIYQNSKKMEAFRFIENEIEKNKQMKEKENGKN